jgi:uncharacterized protein (AIM24 family)
VEVSLEGTVARTARLAVDGDAFAWASKGSIISYTAGLRWDVRMPGGLAGALKRARSGEGLSLTYDALRLALGENALQRAVRRRGRSRP